MGIADAVLAAGLVQAQNPTPLSRTLHKLKMGQNIAITFVGDSILNGSTAGSPGSGAGAGGSYVAVNYTGAVVADNDAASLFCNALAAAYGVTVTKRNRAVGGTTVAYWMANYQSLPLADRSDLYVIGFGKNDIGAEVGSGVAALNGYPLASSLAALESFLRRLLRDVPGGVLPPDVLFLATNPYGSSGTTLNAALTKYNRGMERIARAYSSLGVDFADGFAAFPTSGAARDALLTDGTHPNTAGHALLYSALIAKVPTSWPQSRSSAILPAKRQDMPQTALYDVARFTRLGYTHLTANVFTLVGAGGKNRMNNTGGNWSGAGPYTNTGAATGQFTLFIFKGTECYLDYVGGSGQGFIHINVDGFRRYTSLDLSTMTNGKIIALTGLGRGTHHVQVEVAAAAGSVGGGTAVTVNGFWFLPDHSNFIDAANTNRVGTSGGGSITASTQTAFYSQNGLTASTSGAVYTVQFYGTGLSIEWQMLVGAYTASSFTVDGVAQPTVTIGQSGTAVPSPIYGSVVLVSGLTPGWHTAVMSIGGGSNMAVAGFSEFDESRLDYPTAQKGVAKVGEVITFAVPFTRIPTISFVNTGSTGTAFYPTSVTTTGFTIAGGAAGDMALWAADGDLVTY